MSTNLGTLHVMIVVASKYLVPKGFAGMAIYPFILLRNKRLKNDLAMLTHERIHLRQQAELLVIPFYIWYITEYLVRLIMYRNRHRAYGSICFEREAYANEANSLYLNQRPMWNFLRYI